MKIQRDTHLLLDALIDHLELKNDAQLCEALQVARPIISKVRNKRIPVSASLLLRMHEVTALSVQELRFLLGEDPSKGYFGTASKEEGGTA